MSVIFQEEKIGELTSQLKSALKNNSTIEHSTLFSRLKWNKDFIFDFNNNISFGDKANVALEQLKEDYAVEWVERRMWEILIGNLTTYSLQYAKEKIGSFYDYVDAIDKAEPKAFQAKECAKMISAIDYNLSSNDGNRFISQKNEEFITMLKDWLPKAIY